MGPFQGIDAERGVERRPGSCRGLKVRTSHTHPRWSLLVLLDRAGIDAPPGADQLDDLSIYAVPMRYADLLDAESLYRDATVALADGVGHWATTKIHPSS